MALGCSAKQRPVGDRLFQSVRPQKTRTFTLHAAFEFEPDQVSPRASSDAVNLDADGGKQTPAVQLVSVVRE